MNDQLLREDGGAWQAPPVAPPDLGRALARSRERRTRLGSGALLVGLVAVAAGAVLFRPANLLPAVPAETPTPTPSVTAPPTGPRPLPPDGPLAAGTYLVDATSQAAGYTTIELTVPDGWAVADGRVGRDLGGPAEVSVSFWNPLGAYADGCAWRSSEVIRYQPGETGWFAHFPRQASDADQVSLGGRPALRVELSVSDQLDPAACDDGEYRSWYEWSGTANTNHAAGQTDAAYVIDADGVGVVVDAVSRPDSGAAALAQLAVVLDSLVIEPADPALPARLARAALAHLPLGGQTPTAESGRAVPTTLGRAREALASGILGAGAADTEVWLVQVTGRFDCSTCPRPAGEDGPTGAVLSVVLDRELRREYGVALANRPADLADLGEVTEFDLG